MKDDDSPAHLLSVQDRSLAAVEALFDLATKNLEHLAMPSTERPAAPLRGACLAMLFCEASTRTRASFELAGKHLGMHTLQVDSNRSSLQKGETMLDTLRTLAALQANVLVLRHSASGAAAYVAPRLRIPVINAGDGQHEHPTQALTDAFVLRRTLGSLQGRIIAVCGDIAHSRVARSNSLLLQRLGCTMRFVGPRSLLPRQLAGALQGQVFHRLEEAVQGADAILVLRLQQERLKAGLLASLADYHRAFGLRPEHLRLAKPGAPVLHPGPINRGVEIDSAVADSPQSSILHQVEAGIAVRMAVLQQCLQRAV